MEKYFLAGTGTATFLDDWGNLVFTTDTLTDSTVSTEVTAEDIKGGLSNPILGQYFHDAIMRASITDSLFSLEYLASKLGGKITIGGDAMTSEEVEVLTDGEFTVRGTPKDWFGTGVKGIFTVLGEDDWNTVEFTGKTAKFAGLKLGTKLCVRYVSRNSGKREFIVPSVIIPDIGTMIIRTPLFKATNRTETMKRSTQAGFLEIVIPKFQLDGGLELSLTASGASTTNLSGVALRAFTAEEGCDGLGMYAKISEVLFDKDFTDDLIDIGVDGGNIDVSVGQEKLIRVIGLYKGNVTGIINDEDLTFVSENPEVATVTDAGVVTGVVVGATSISINVTKRPDIVRNVAVTVS